ncbi:IbrB-like domain-containing protein [Nocardia wallacei]|uniref:IbrB-like domain-containing protein n=1 Tax=Nocardia wallacei TaxID=480035 RepID=UPI0024562D53|nr:ParB/RepB/Spo0J family partition protein [Nocardia wallacei]
MSEQTELDLGTSTAAEPDTGAIVADAAAVFARLAGLDEQTRIDVINALRADLHRYSPMAAHPVDCIQWLPADTVEGNAYNPNVVAKPELELLRRSITADGYTQPIVTWRDGTKHEVVDGFHRHLLGKTDPDIADAVHGRLPITVINTDRTDKADRMAATIRHNRARGEHTVDGMSQIVLELARRGKSDEWIGNELGMDPDEVNRLRVVTGLAEMFADDEFSEAWEADTDPQGTTP